jgi:hypothetical protein
VPYDAGRSIGERFIFVEATTGYEPVMRVFADLLGDVALQCLDYCSLTSRLYNVRYRISCPIGTSFGKGTS